jgi:hypothetical protein
VASRESVVKIPVEIAVESPFESATLSIWVDGKLTYQREMTGQTKKKLWVVKSAQSDLSGTMAVPAGKHLLRVQLSSEKDHYFGVGRVEGEFVAREPKMLNVSFHGREHQMLVGLQ